MKHVFIAIVAASLPGSVAALSPETLAGAWCYSHYSAGGERGEVSGTYLFHPDGSLLYQTNPSTPVDRPGRYSIDGDTLKIEPTLAFFTFKLKSEEPDRLVFSAMGAEHVFLRGACP